MLLPKKLTSLKSGCGLQNNTSRRLFIDKTFASGFMNLTFKPSFFRDAKKIPIKLHPELNGIITKVESAQTLRDIPNLKKLKGHKTAYRIKVGDYRLCFFFDDEVISVVRFLPRKDVYRSFP